MLKWEWNHYKNTYWTMKLLHMETFSCDSFSLLTIALLYFDLTSGLPNLWLASTSFSSIFIFMSDIMEITVFSKLLSSMESGIPLITMLFFLPYWAREFCSVSSLTIFASSLLHFCCSSHFLPANVWLLRLLNYLSHL